MFAHINHSFLLLNNSLVDINSNLTDITLLATVQLTGTSQIVNVSSLNELSKKYKFISIELQMLSGTTYYTHTSTQYPLKYFIDGTQRTIRTSVNNGTYLWTGVNRVTDTSINISCASGMSSYIAIVRVYN